MIRERKSCSTLPTHRFAKHTLQKQTPSYHYLLTFVARISDGVPLLVVKLLYGYIEGIG